MNRTSKSTAAANRRYAKMRELYFADNPTCEYCGRAAVEEFDHVMRGPNRGKSLTNPLTGLATCSACHRERGDDKPIAKFAAKVRAMLRRANEYAWYEGRANPPERFSVAELIEELTNGK